MPARTKAVALLAALLVAVIAAPASGQGLSFPASPGGVAVLRIPPEMDPHSPEGIRLREMAVKRRGYELELREFKKGYFGRRMDRSVRDMGLEKIRGYEDPAAFPLLSKILADAGDDVRDAVLDHYADLDTPEADAALAWEAVYHRNAGWREAAMDRLAARHRGGREPAQLVVDVLANGLREREEPVVVRASAAAAQLSLLQLIPLMAQAQVTTAGTGGGGGPRGDLAYIFIGRQTAFIADLVPVVSDSAVAFDPQVGVISEGVILRVTDAFVAEYRPAVNGILTGMADDLTGFSTASLGYDVPAWLDWYTGEIQPVLQAGLRPSRLDRD